MSCPGGWGGGRGGQLAVGGSSCEQLAASSWRQARGAATVRRGGGSCPACLLHSSNLQRRGAWFEAYQLPFEWLPSPARPSPAPHPAAALPSSLWTPPTTMPLAASRPLWKAGPGPPSTAACARTPSAQTCRRAPLARGAAASPPTQPAPRSATCQTLKLRPRTSEWQDAGWQPAAGRWCVQEAAAVWHAPQGAATLLGWQRVNLVGWTCM